MNILMPQLGETVAEGKIIAWYKSIGDAVTAGDSLFEIETDKTSMEVPAMVAGVIAEIRVAAGETVPIGTVVAIVAESAPAGLATSTVEASKPTPLAADPFNAVRTPKQNFGRAQRADGIHVTPLARRLAAQASVELDTVIGSGPAGRIVGRDIDGAAHLSPAPGGTISPTLIEGTSAEQVKALYAAVPYREEALDGMRRTIARRLVESTRTIPHFYLSMDVEMNQLAIERKALNAASGGAYKLTINDFVIKALAMALQQVPEANAVWAGNRLLRFQYSDVSVAVAVNGGLFTPIVRRAEQKSLNVISGEVKQLAARARDGLLKAGDYEGGTISVSNLGMYGVRTFSAIINPPQAAILAVGSVRRKPFERPDGAVEFRSAMSVTLCCDHRVIDGALGARLLAAFRELMESPQELMS